MAGITLSVALLLVALAASAQGESPTTTNEPAFPTLLDMSNPSQRRIRILSERFESGGGYTAAEEIVDLELGKAVYIETSNSVRSTWLINVRENTTYQYWPYSCNKYGHVSLEFDSPYIVRSGAPKAESIDGQQMYLFGLSALIELMRVSSSKQYTRTGAERIGHKWSLHDTGNLGIQVFFSEQQGQSGTAAEQELLLESVEIQRGSATTTINVLSIERELPVEVYNNELQLPLIYGCRRDPTVELSPEMKRVLDVLTADTNTRHHLKAFGKATSFASNNPSSTEPMTVELALSQPHDAYGLSPIRAHMSYQQSAQANTRTVVDRWLNVKYEVNSLKSTCRITNAGQPFLQQDSSPIVLKFSEELVLNVTSRDLESMLYGVTAEGFMRLEQHGSAQHAYFADQHAQVFGPNKMGRVIRKFSFAADGQLKLDSFAIWVFESVQNDWKVNEVYDFQIVESKSLASDVNSAQAFDVSRECFTENAVMRQGRDFAWFELDYSVAADKIELLRGQVDELKSTFYRQLRAKTNLDYLRVPKMEITFGESGFTLRLLILEQVPLHLIYERLEGVSISGASEQVDSLFACSELCRSRQCISMSFSAEDHKCNVSQTPVDLDRSLERCEGAVTYLLRDAQQLQLLPLDELRLERQIQAIQQSSSRRLGGMPGFDESNNLRATTDLKSIGNLRLLFQLNGQLVDLLPSGSRVELASDAQPASPTEPSVDVGPLP